MGTLPKLTSKFRFLYWFCAALVLFPTAAGLRPLRERARSWGDEVGLRKFWVLFLVLVCMVVSELSLNFMAF